MQNAYLQKRTLLGAGAIPEGRRPDCFSTKPGAVDGSVGPLIFRLAPTGVAAHRPTSFISSRCSRSNAIGGDGTQYQCNRPATLCGRQPPMNAKNQRARRALTTNQTFALRFRLRQLAAFKRYRRQGFPVTEAERLAGLSPATRWRWESAFRKHGRAGLVPGISPGRPSSSASFAITVKIVLAVQELQVQRRCGNAAAWRVFADDPRCPADLANFLRTVKYIPGRFLQATRLKRSRAIVTKGNGFTHIQEKP